MYQVPSKGEIRKARDKIKWDLGSRISGPNFKKSAKGLILVRACPESNANREAKLQLRRKPLRVKVLRDSLR